MKSFLSFYVCMQFVLCMVGTCFAESEKDFFYNFSLPSQSLPYSSHTSWYMRAAEDALAEGLPSLAEAFYTKVLQQETLTALQERSLILQLTSALLQQEKWAQAKDFLERVSLKNTAWYLRHAWVCLYEKEWSIFIQDLKRIQENELTKAERPWYYLLKGLWFSYTQDLEESKKCFQNAIDFSSSSLQQATVQYVRIKEELLAGFSNPQSLEFLREKMAECSLFERPSWLVLQYTIALNEAGERERAIEYLREYFDSLDISAVQDRARVAILISLLIGIEQESSQKYLRLVLQEKAEKNLQMVALKLLVQSRFKDNDPNFFDTFLNSLLEDSGSNISFLDEIYLLQAHWEFSQKHFNRSQASALALLEKFPGSALKNNAIRLLACIACEKTPPEYRLAADYFSKLLPEEKNPNERARLELLIADTFFLAQDYEGAAKIYWNLLQNTNSVLDQGQNFYQLILCYIRLDKLDIAESLLNEGHAFRGISSFYIHKAEWNFIYGLYLDGQMERALIRLQSLKDSHLDFSIKIRFEWMEGQLHLLFGEYKVAKNIASAILDQLSREDVEGEEFSKIRSQVLMMKARSCMNMGQTEEGLAIFKQVQKEYGFKPEGLLSCMEEARHHFASNNIVEALRLCVHIADIAPQSIYAPIALYEAACYAQARGQNTALEGAISILERLIKDYPDSALVYYARVKQGDILRQLNRFEAAILLYKDILLQYPEHPERYYVQLLEVKALLGLGLQVPEQFSESITICDYLIDLPSVPVDFRVEAAYHKGFAYFKKGSLDLAKEAYWLAVSNFLKNTENFNQMSPKGHYWLSRSLFDLALCMEQSGEKSEISVIYKLIIDYNLPGHALAQSKLKTI